MQRAPRTKVLHSADLLGLRQPFVERNAVWPVIHIVVLAQITFQRSQYNFHSWAVFVDLRNPLGANVLERVPAVNLYSSCQSLPS